MLGAWTLREQPKVNCNYLRGSGAQQHSETFSPNSQKVLTLKPLVIPGQSFGTRASVSLTWTIPAEAIWSHGKLMSCCGSHIRSRNLRLEEQKRSRSNWLVTQGKGPLVKTTIYAPLEIQQRPCSCTRVAMQAKRPVAASKRAGGITNIIYIMHGSCNASMAVSQNTGNHAAGFGFARSGWHFAGGSVWEGGLGVSLCTCVYTHYFVQLTSSTP